MKVLGQKMIHIILDSDLKLLFTASDLQFSAGHWSPIGNDTCLYWLTNRGHEDDRSEFFGSIGLHENLVTSYYTIHTEN